MAHEELNIPATLMTTTAKVRALSDLFAMAGVEPPITEVGYKGISYVLEEIADDLDAIRETNSELTRSKQ